MKKLANMFLAFGLLGTALSAFATGTVENNVYRTTTSGAPIYAQGGAISKFGSTYYWYGVQYSGASTYYSTGVGSSDNVFQSVNVYSSIDLINWKTSNTVVTTSTAGFSNTTWVGRLSQVLYNSSTKLYVMWIVYDGPDGDGEACLTSSSPTGPFTINNVQTSFTNVYDSLNGDSSIFVDVAHGSTPYFIFSDAHGREHAYIAPLSSNYESIEAATLISEWPQGQEANNMFEYNGNYYYVMSNLAGFGYSSAYVVWSPNILTPSDYTKDAAFAGTTATDTYYSQVGFVIELQGDETTSYIESSDRWLEFDDSYANAGFGKGFYVWAPITFSGATPTYNPTTSLTISYSTGELSWSGI